MNRPIQIIRLLLLTLSCSAYSVSDFQGGPFSFKSKSSGIYPVDVGLDGYNGIMLAFGDFNGDKSSDVVTVSSDGTSLDIQLWKDNTFTSTFVGNSGANQPIVGVIPGDFNYDGLLDFIAVLYQAEAAYIIKTFIQSQTNPMNFDVQAPFLQSTTYPFVADFLGDLHLEVMYTDVNTKLRMIADAVTGQGVTFASLIAPAGGACLDPTNIITQPILEDNFSATVDVSNDCRADLMITSAAGLEYYYTMYITSGDTPQPYRFCLMQVASLTNVISLSYVDVNFDGAIDMVSVVQNANTQSVVINYSKNMNPVATPNLCQSETANNKQTNLYPYDPIALINGPYTQVNQLMIEAQAYTLYQPTNVKQFAPFVRFGDYLATGFPGAMVVVWNGTYASTQQLVNQEVSDSILTVSFPRQLVLADSNGKAFQDITEPSAVQAAFFDFGENGRLDMLLNTYNETTKQFEIQAFYNYLSLDAFYLKSLGTNGQCSASDDGNIGCLGALYYGTTYQFRVTDINGNYKPAVGSQLSQSANTPLQLPYSYSGLGRTNNYVENFFVGMPLVNGALKSWTPIIPNSQLIVSPNTPSTSKWTLSIFIEPTEAILIVVVVTVIILLILGGVIVWKHIKEKEEDKKKQEHIFQMFR